MLQNIANAAGNIENNIPQVNSIVYGKVNIINVLGHDIYVDTPEKGIGLNPL